MEKQKHDVLLASLNRRKLLSLAFRDLPLSMFVAALLPTEGQPRPPELPKHQSVDLVVNDQMWLAHTREVVGSENANWQITKLDYDPAQFGWPDATYYLVETQSTRFFAYSRTERLQGDITQIQSENPTIVNRYIPVFSPTTNQIPANEQCPEPGCKFAEGVTELLEVGFRDGLLTQVFNGIDKEYRVESKGRLLRLFIPTTAVGTNQHDILLPGAFHDYSQSPVVVDVPADKPEIIEIGLKKFALTGLKKTVFADVERVVKELVAITINYELWMQLSGFLSIHPETPSVAQIFYSSVQNYPGFYFANNHYLSLHGQEHATATFGLNIRTGHLVLDEDINAHEATHAADYLKEPGKPNYTFSYPREAVGVLGELIYLSILGNTTVGRPSVLFSTYLSGSNSGFKDEGYQLFSVILHTINKYGFSGNYLDFLATYQQTRLQMKSDNSELGWQDAAYILHQMSGSEQQPLSFLEENKALLLAILTDSFRTETYTFMPHLKQTMQRIIDTMQFDNSTQLLQKINQPQPLVVNQAWCWFMVSATVKSFKLRLYQAEEQRELLSAANTLSPVDTYQVEAKAKQLQAYPGIKIYLPDGLGSYQEVVTTDEQEVDLTEQILILRNNRVAAGLPEFPAEPIKVLVFNDVHAKTEADSSPIMVSATANHTLYLPSIKGV